MYSSGHCRVDTSLTGRGVSHIFHLIVDLVLNASKRLEDQLSVRTRWMQQTPHDQAAITDGTQCVCLGTDQVSGSSSVQSSRRAIRVAQPKSTCHENHDFLEHHELKTRLRHKVWSVPEASYYVPSTMAAWVCGVCCIHRVLTQSWPLSLLEALGTRSTSRWNMWLTPRQVRLISTHK